MVSLTKKKCFQDDFKKINYVKISAESYVHLTELECEVKTLSEKLSSAQSEMVTKDNLVKQHAKVAEEAVTGLILKLLLFAQKIYHVVISHFFFHIS